MSTLTVTHTRTHLVITPANPFLACATCGKRAEAFHDDECGCGETGRVNMPCFHRGDYSDLCPSWGPVDGCQCLAHLGHIPHPAVLPRSS
jgi:hypothetical protein